MFILKKGHQPGVYVPLRALFLVLIMKSLSFMFTLAICPILNGYTQVVF